MLPRGDERVDVDGRTLKRGREGSDADGSERVPQRLGTYTDKLF